MENRFLPGSIYVYDPYQGKYFLCYPINSQQPAPEKNNGGVDNNAKKENNNFLDDLWNSEDGLMSAVGSVGQGVVGGLAIVGEKGGEAGFKAVAEVVSPHTSNGANNTTANTEAGIGTVADELGKGGEEFAEGLANFRNLD